MSRISKYISIIIGIIILNGCITNNVPSTYVHGTKNLNNNPYGCWLIVHMNSNYSEYQGQEVGGELLAIEKDTVYLLVEDFNIIICPAKNIISAKLITHKNQAGTFALFTGLFITPNIIGALAYGIGGFMILAIPVAITGLTVTLIEATGQGNVLLYPEKSSLKSFGKFARFPQGIPTNVDTKQLTLKKIE